MWTKTNPIWRTVNIPHVQFDASRRNKVALWFSCLSRTPTPPKSGHYELDANEVAYLILLVSKREGRIFQRILMERRVTVPNIFRKRRKTELLLPVKSLLHQNLMAESGESEGRLRSTTKSSRDQHVADARQEVFNAAQHYRRSPDSSPLARHWRCMISSLLALAIGSSGNAKNSDVVYIQCEVCKRAIKVAPNFVRFVWKGQIIHFHREDHRTAQKLWQL